MTELDAADSAPNAAAPLMRVRRAVVIKDSVNVKKNLSAHTRSWASMPRRQVGHLRGADE